MRFIAATASVIAFTCLLGQDALAQQAVPPRWNWQGSAVCPNGFDYYASQGLCISRGRYGDGRGYRGSPYGAYRMGIPPRWNRAGSAVCPTGYDYHIRLNLCLPQPY